MEDIVFEGLHVRRLEGMYTPPMSAGADARNGQGSEQPLLEIENAVIAVPEQRLNKMLGDSLGGSALSGLEISLSDKQIQVDGEAIQVLPFQATGEVGATQEGKVRVQITDLEAAGLPAKGLLGLVGADIETIVSPDKPGVTANENSLLFDPEYLVESVRLRGQVSRAWVEGSRLMVLFGEPELDRPQADQQEAQKQRPEGVLRIGDMTVTGRGLQMQ